MTNVESLAAEIVAREGGFVNDPADPGGATKYGVTLKTLTSLGMGRTVAALKRITKADAEQVFIAEYFKRPGIDKLPEALQPSVFDMQVNAGSNAVRILQRLLPDFGHPVTVDGALGPNTDAAVAEVYAKAGRYLVDAYGIARRNYYLQLADRKPGLRKFARTRAGGKGGWIKRAEEFMLPKYRLTDAEFAARVKSWAT